MKQVTHTYRTGEPPVLDRLDLTVGQGEFLCVLGASGSGKSTLLSLLGGLEHPSSGTVSLPSPRPALMFQEHALFPWLTAGGNVELALRFGGLPKAERDAEARRLLALVRLPGAYDRPVHELSGGMRQRVALARALAQGSRVLLMDEPFAALDTITRDVLHEVFLDVWKARGLTVVFVTHQVSEAVRLATRVVLLSSHPGRIAHSWRAGEPGADGATITARLREEIRRHAPAH
ncbi:ABC transporter ATP-binding protein [Streptomyces sp. NBC_00102]|uniref:ABC transporter ATP-binding protein n=1 Tax=Streptomyces sp. NBC_00102 TaxID=2975652 RepID=UPI002255CD0D|nr:ATP-binding cassette domain-containing protein [Streptomyces sp. NBC_00102]MCX5397925.1 ATP-binding cassette domain-containing protein [Streptomyces sp. NBC_00102]